MSVSILQILKFGNNCQVGAKERNAREVRGSKRRNLGAADLPEPSLHGLSANWAPFLEEAQVPRCIRFVSQRFHR